MTKLQAILHLYRTGRISEEKAYNLAAEKGLSDEEIEMLRLEIEKMKSPESEFE